MCMKHDAFFDIVANYCLKCEFFTLDNDIFCVRNGNRPDKGVCDEFEDKISLKMALRC